MLSRYMWPLARKRASVLSTVLYTYIYTYINDNDNELKSFNTRFFIGGWLSVGPKSFARCALSTKGGAT